MMEKIIKYKKYIISIALMLLLSILFINMKYLLPKKYEELPEVRLREIKSSKSFAIMVQNGENYEEYTSEDDKWPGADYVFKEAKCTDNNGELVDNAITYADGTVTLETDKTVYCTLYFDEKSKAEITNASKICDMGTSMSIEFTTSGPVGEYYYSTNGKDFTKGNENLYSIQRLESGANQKIYVYVTDSDGKKSETKEYDFTTKTLGKSMTASELKASKPKDLNTNDIETQGGMYRYQGTDNVDNWIMFGAECTNEYTKLSEEEKIDKYMYRIIGITKEGQMYLLKETFLKEGDVTGFTWNDKYYVDSSHPAYCDDGLCPEWNTSLLFKRINGTSNGEIQGTVRYDNANTDIFVDSEYYNYLKSEDKINGAKDDKGSEWYQLIANHDWMYGDTNVTDRSVIYNGKNMYDIETGKTSTSHYVGTKGNITLEPYEWNKEKAESAKISLMYMNDIAYAYYDGLTEDSRGNPGSTTNVKNSWIHFEKDGYNTSSNYEWLSTRWGVNSTSSAKVDAYCVNSGGGLVADSNLGNAYSVRPVFYLESRAKIVDGDGTKLNPFIINL